MKPTFLNCRIAGWGVDSEAYHRQDAKRGEVEFAMSPSSIKAFLECPARWKDGYEPPQSDAKDWGNLVDLLALTPKAFGERYAVRPQSYPATKNHDKVKAGAISEGSPVPWNENATFCKVWSRGQRDSGRTVISEREHASATFAANRLLADPKIRAFLECSDRQVLVCGEYQTEDGIKFPVRCLLDLAPCKDSEFSDCLGDLKTTRNAGVMQFGRFALQMKYHLQAAFDLDLFNAATGEARSTWCFVVQENYRPFQTGRRIFSQAFIEAGRRAYVSALDLYGRCLKSGVWPGYDDTDEAAQGWSIIDAPPWLEGNDAFEPKFEIPETETDEVPEGHYCEIAGKRMLLADAYKGVTP